MKKLILPLGILLIVAGGIAWLLASKSLTYPTWTVIAGIILVAVHIGLNLQELARRSTMYGINALLMALFMVVILVVIYMIAQKRDKTWDLSASGQYTLDPQTAKILDQLDQPVRILLFYNSMDRGREYDQVKTLLDLYKAQTDKLTYQILDPNKDYDSAVNYMNDLNPIGQATLIAEVGEGDKKFKEKAKSLSQEDISNAIKKVTHREPVTVYFLVGHYEKELDSQQPNGLALLKQFLEDENITASPLRLGANAEIPEDADVIALIGPEEDLSPTELGALKQFVLKGGGLIMALDPGNYPNLQMALKEYGIELASDTIIEMAVGAQSIEDALMGRYTAKPSDRVQIEKFDGKHEITKDLQTAGVELTRARSINQIPSPPEGISLTALAHSAEGDLQASGGVSIPKSWGEMHPEELAGGNVSITNMYDANVDKRGPLPVILAGEIDLAKISGGQPDPDNPSRKGKIIVVGDSDFLTVGGMMRGRQGSVSRGHHDLALNMFNWLAGQVDLITIRKPEIAQTSLTLTAEQKSFVRNLTMIVTPGLILLLGIGVMIYRRISY